MGWIAPRASIKNATWKNENPDWNNTQTSKYQRSMKKYFNLWEQKTETTTWYHLHDDH